MQEKALKTKPFSDKLSVGNYNLPKGQELDVMPRASVALTPDPAGGQWLWSRVAAFSLRGCRWGGKKNKTKEKTKLPVLFFCLRDPLFSGKSF